MEQAGVYKITFYENKDLQLSYSGNSIVSISNNGDIVTLENSDCNTSELALIQTPERNANNKLKYLSTINYILYDYSVVNLRYIQTLKRSIYGWIALIEFYNNYKKIIPSPLRFDNSGIKNESNSFSIQLSNVISGGKPIDFIEQVAEEWILEQGYWNGAGDWTTNGIWKTI